MNEDINSLKSLGCLNEVSFQALEFIIWMNCWCYPSMPSEERVILC